MRDRAGPFTLLDMVGEGGQGSVWRARHRPTGRLVAVKIYRPAIDEALERRVIGELRAVARLDHPGIVALLGERSFLGFEVLIDSIVFRNQRITRRVQLCLQGDPRLALVECTGPVENKNGDRRTRGAGPALGSINSDLRR